MPKYWRFSVTNESTLFCTKGEIFAANWQFSALCWIGGGWQRGLKIFDSVAISWKMHLLAMLNNNTQEIERTKLRNLVFSSQKRKEILREDKFQNSKLAWEEDMWGSRKTFDSNRDCFSRQIAMNRVLAWKTKERNFPHISWDFFGYRHFLGLAMSWILFKTFLGKTISEEKRPISVPTGLSLTRRKR